MRSKTSIKNGIAEKIFELRGKGYSYRDIELEIGCSKSTISYHLGKGQKLKTKIRTQKNLPISRQLKEDFIYELKLNTPCSRCNQFVDPSALDIHHRDRRTKRVSLSEGLRGNYSILSLQKEIDKCDALCTNCHRIVESEINQDFYFTRRKKCMNLKSI